MRVVIIVVVMVAFVAVGGYLIFARGSGAKAQTLTINASVSGTTMTPSKITVHDGDKVTMNVTVDKKEEIHLHGYNIPFEGSSAGDKVTHSFTADKTGSFEIEIEDTSTPVGSLEVLPR